MVLYIPDYVLPSDIPQIKQKFQENKLGKVVYVELAEQVECEYQVDRDIYCAAYIYVNWYDTQEADDFKQQVLNNDVQAKVIYNEEGDFWEFEYSNDEFQLNFENNKLQEDFTTLKNEFDNFKTQINNLSERVSTSDWYNYYNCNGVQYLLEIDRKNMIKKQRAEKTRQRYKKNIVAQRKWQNILRPRSVLKTVH